MALSRSIKRITSLFVLICAQFAGSLFAQNEICELSIQTCPENLNGQTISVGPEVVALSANIFACDPTQVIEGIIDSGGPPSIVFVIDHSFSMMGLGNTYPGNDVDGSRFNVTRDLIDTIFTKHKDAEIGVVVFREVLYFDKSNNDHFVALPGFGNQAYLPLMQLDRQYKGNTTGIAVLKSILQTERVTRYNEKFKVNVDCVDLKYKPVFSTIGNTNINSAFDAAKKAMETAKNPVDRQFIIFLSDGEPFPLGDNSQHGGKDPFTFKQGLNTPTTFTVYLHNTETQAPQSLQDMTTNIRNNKYSTSNPKSEIWTIKTDYQALMNLFMTRVLKPILLLTSGSPVRMVINKLVSTNINDTAFVYADPFPLQPDKTVFDMQITYRLTNQRTASVRDTTTLSNFTIQRSTTTTLLPEGVTKICWTQPRLDLYYQGAPVETVNETMGELEIRFSQGTGAYTAVNAEVSNFQGETKDIENIALTQGTAYWSKTFVREIAIKPVANDKKLQHRAVDSIIVVYRNPKIPLDTLRVAYPFVVSKSIGFNSALYYDVNADGFVDSIFIGLSGTVTAQDLQSIRNWMTLPAYRVFTIESMELTPGGIALKVKESGSADPRTAVGAQDRITIKSGILPGGGLVVDGDVPVTDKVAPVIVSAQLYVSGSTEDTLKVTFSEGTERITHNQPFQLQKPSGTPYTIIVQAIGDPQGNQYTFVVKSVQGADEVQQGDLIQINAGASIGDLPGNDQLDPANRKVPITVKQVPYSITPRVIQNPYTPGAAVQLPDPVIKAYRQSGMIPPSGGLVIMVEPQSELRGHIKMAATVSIYDVVKNPVVIDKPMAFDDIKKRLYFAWDARNSQGRIVGTGTYMAVIKISDNQDLKETKFVTIGVKR